MKIKNILTEWYDNILSFDRSYIKLFKLLYKKGFKQDDIKNAEKFLRSVLEFEREVSSSISLLYNKNFRENGDFENLNDENWIGLSDKDLSEPHKAIGAFYEVHPLLFKHTDEDMGIEEFSFDEVFEPLIDIEEFKKPVNKVAAAYKSDLREAAINKVNGEIESLWDEGANKWDYFPDYFLTRFVEIDQKTLKYNAINMAAEEYEQYLYSYKKNGFGHDSLLEMIEMYDEFHESDDAYAEVTKDIEMFENENLILTNKYNKFDSERYKIELEIERLSDVIDYEMDDEDNYPDDEMDKLESFLNRIENKLSNIDTQINENEKTLSQLYLEQEQLEEVISRLNFGEEFKSLYIQKRSEIIMEEYNDDVYQYAGDLDTTVGEAIDEGILYVVNENKLIEYYVDEI